MEIERSPERRRVTERQGEQPAQHAQQNPFAAKHLDDARCRCADGAQHAERAQGQPHCKDARRNRKHRQQRAGFVVTPISPDFAG